MRGAAAGWFDPIRDACDRQSKQRSVGLGTLSCGNPQRWV